MRTTILTLLSLFFTTCALAQTAPITGTNYQIYTSSQAITVTTPFREGVIPAASITCNLTATPPPTGTVVNPKFLEWDEQGVSTKCRADMSAIFSALPVATGYKATITYSSVAGPSARSNATGPFDVQQVPPAAPTGVGVRP